MKKLKKLLVWMGPLRMGFLMVGPALVVVGFVDGLWPFSMVGGAMIGAVLGITVANFIIAKRKEAADKAWAATLASATPPAAFPAGVFWPTTLVPTPRQELIVKGKLFIFGDGKILLALDGTEISHAQFNQVKEALDNWAADPMIRSMIIAGVEVEIITPEVRNATTVLSEASDVAV